MFERAQIRVLPVMNRASEHAPVAIACCNACRACTTTNVIGLVFAGAGATVALVARFARRFG